MLANENYLQLYSNRRTDGAARKAWHRASLKLIEDSYRASPRSIDDAACHLAKTHTFTTVRTLAYSAYCFWYQPFMKQGLVSSRDPVTSWSINAALQDMLPRARHKDVALAFKEASRRLTLATIAFDAGVQLASGYNTFQQEVFAKTLIKIAYDPDMKETALRWPQAFDEGGAFLPDTVGYRDVNGRAVKVLSPTYMAKVKELGTKELLERASFYLVASAAEVRPELFSDHPKVEARLYVPDDINGTYSYGRERASYFFNDQGIYNFCSFLSAAVGALHETEHFLQAHLALSIDSMEPKDALLKGALLFADNFKAQMNGNKDGALSMYSGGLGHWDAFSMAYYRRPLESFAHRTTAFGSCLREHWGRPFHAMENVKHDYLVRLGQKALSKSAQTKLIAPLP